MKIFYTLIVVAVLIFGGYWYFGHKGEVADIVNNINDTKDNVIATTTKDVDIVIKNTIESVSKVSLLYYVQNKNYGISPTQNICIDATSKGSLVNIIATLQKYTKKVNCVVDPDFPSRSFTILVSSLATPNLSYCTDQSGFYEINMLGNKTFKEGRKCQ